MELRHLRYFVVLADELHFGRAASRLAITQPPLSFNIKQLEEELRVKLLDRDNKRVSLTQAGAAFLTEANAILANAERARELARAIGLGFAGRLDVGFSGSMIYSGMPSITRRFASENPEVLINFNEAGLPDQIEMLERGVINVAFVDTANVPEGLEGYRMGDEPYVCCVPSSHPLAEEDIIELDQLGNEAFVMFRRSGAPTSYDRVVNMCEASGFTPKVTHAVKQWLTIVSLVAEGFGVALVPHRMARTELKGVSFVPLTAEKQVISVSSLLWNPAKIDATGERFVQTAKAVVEKEIMPEMAV